MTALQNEELRQQLHDARNEVHRLALERDGLAGELKVQEAWNNAAREEVEQWVELAETIDAVLDDIEKDADRLDPHLVNRLRHVRTLLSDLVTADRPVGAADA